ncbi:hypothetical protein ACFLWS_07810 [Chloroflexota bacterium]
MTRALLLPAAITSVAGSYSWWDGWGVLFTGAGAITLVLTIVRWQIPLCRSKWVGIIWGLILLAIGLGTWMDMGWLWVVALATVGIIILKEAITRKS